MATVQDVIKRIGDITQDTTHVRWTDAELLRWIEDAQLVIALRRPSAYPKTDVFPLVAGTRQTLPVGAVAFLDAPRNMAADGIAPGRAIRPADRRILDDQMPDWHTSAAAPQVVHVMYNVLDPKTFYVYPPSPGGNKIELVYSATPPAPTNVNATLALESTYLAPIVDYVLYRAYTKDAEYAGNAQRAVAHKDAFEAEIGSINTVENATTINNKLRSNGIA